MDLLNPDVRANLYPAFAQLREDESGVVKDAPFPGTWTLTRYADVNAAFRDSDRLTTEFFREFASRMLDWSNPAHKEFANLFTHTMMLVDGPQHVRRRTLVSKAFTRRAIERMQPRVMSLATDLIEKLDGPAEIDFMETVARPLPAMVISEMLAFPAPDVDQIHRWALSGGLAFEPTLDEVTHERMRADVIEFCDYIRDTIAQRRRDLGDDLLSNLITVEESGDKLSLDELVSMVLLLYSAGDHTTTSLLGNGLGLLLDTPGALHELNAAPDRIPDAVEEMLRLKPSFTMIMRMTKIDVKVAAQTIPRGTLVFLAVGAANRDPRSLDRADELLLDRKDLQHITFGAGAHFCLGAPLARLEANCVFTLLLKRYPNLRSGVAPREYLPYLVMPQYASLPIRAQPL